MSIKKIIALYDIAVGLVSDAVYHILNAIPEQSYEFEQSIRVPYTNDFNGDMYNISIRELFLNNIGVACVRYTDEYDNEGVCDLHSLDDHTVYFILNSIDEKTLSAVTELD